jgi:hypothetical protein
LRVFRVVLVELPEMSVGSSVYVPEIRSFEVTCQDSLP